MELNFLMDIVKGLPAIIKDGLGNSIIQGIIGLLGLGSVYMISDKIVKFGVEQAFKSETVILDFIDMLDEKYLDPIANKLPESHSAIEKRLLEFLDKLKAKIKD